jgi:hypothetical protein
LGRILSGENPGNESPAKGRATGGWQAMKPLASPVSAHQHDEDKEVNYGWRNP